MFFLRKKSGSVKGEGFCNRFFLFFVCMFSQWFLFAYFFKCFLSFSIFCDVFLCKGLSLFMFFFSMRFDLFFARRGWFFFTTFLKEFFFFFAILSFRRRGRLFFSKEVVLFFLRCPKRVSFFERFFRGVLFFSHEFFLRFFFFDVFCSFFQEGSFFFTGGGVLS